jgi:hypothetical protein
MEINIEFKGIPLRVVGEYEAGENRELYQFDLGGYPGSLPSFLVEEVYAEDSEIDIFELFSPADLEVLSEKILEQIED